MISFQKGNVKNQWAKLTVDATQNYYLWHFNCARHPILAKSSISINFIFWPGFTLKMTRILFNLISHRIYRYFLLSFITLSRLGIADGVPEAQWHFQMKQPKSDQQKSVHEPKPTSNEKQLKCQPNPKNWLAKHHRIRRTRQPEKTLYSTHTHKHSNRRTHADTHRTHRPARTQMTYLDFPRTNVIRWHF